MRGNASDSEDDLVTATVDAGSKQRDGSAATKGKTAVKASTNRKAAAGRPRQALKDRTNVQTADDAEEPNDMDAHGAKPKAKRARTTAASRKKAPVEAVSEPEDEPVQAASSVRTASSSSKTVRGARTMPSSEPLGVIPETQPNPEQMEDIEQSIEEEGVPALAGQSRVQGYTANFCSSSAQPLQVRHSARSASAQPLYSRSNARLASAQPSHPPRRERSASLSGTERERRGGDPEMRRKLNDVTRRNENLHLKLQALEDIAKSKGETNFEKLKRAADQKTKDADELVASLKKQIAELQKSSKSNTSESAALQKQISTLKTGSEKQAAENGQLKAEIAEMKQKLQESQNENKSLEAKLVAARQQASGSAQESKAAGSDAKNAARSTAASATEAQKEAKMKENLYSDLTGLIVRGVKRKEGEDEYDCIQTGRNGSESGPSRLPPDERC